MSKKTHRMAELKDQEKAKKPVPVSVAPKKTSNGKKAQPSASRTSGRGGARSFERPAAVVPAASILYFRIVGGLIAAAALAGGIYWAMSVKQNFTPWVIIGLLALGVLAGMGAFAAIHAKDVAARARASIRRR